MEKHELETLEVDLLLEALYRRYGYDFRSYARASIERRTLQFLAGHGLATVADLLARVLHDEGLFSQLVQYYSVSVTELFRDPFVYRAVRDRVVPVLRTWPHVKVWCAGCATGEEVYSLAIVLREEGILDRTLLYATDFNDASLDRARQGVYPADRIQEATRNYQAAGGRRSFGEYYHARYEAVALDPSLRDRITFANHNLVTDQVFGEMHLVFCRNVLIYFDRDLQTRALKLFTDALVHGGFLCLGTMETLHFSGFSGGYQEVGPKERIYRKTGAGPELGCTSPGGGAA